MAGSVNKVILIGNLGKAPEVRHLENGAVVANFPIATSESYTDKNTGQRVDQTEWHNIVLWRGLAEVAEKYLHKGSKVYIEGKLKTRQWQDKDGNNRYTTEVVGDQMTMLTPKSESEQMNQGNNYPPSQEKSTSQPTTQDIGSDEEDDLPF